MWGGGGGRGVLLPCVAWMITCRTTRYVFWGSRGMLFYHQRLEQDSLRNQNPWNRLQLCRNLPSYVVLAIPSNLIINKGINFSFISQIQAATLQFHLTLIASPYSIRALKRLSILDCQTNHVFHTLTANCEGFLSLCHQKSYSVKRPKYKTNGLIQ